MRSHRPLLVFVLVDLSWSGCLAQEIDWDIVSKSPDISMPSQKILADIPSTRVVTSTDITRRSSHRSDERNELFTTARIYLKTGRRMAMTFEANHASVRQSADSDRTRGQGDTRALARYAAGSGGVSLSVKIPTASTGLGTGRSDTTLRLDRSSTFGSFLKDGKYKLAAGATYNGLEKVGRSDYSYSGYAGLDVPIPQAALVLKLESTRTQRSGDPNINDLAVTLAGAFGSQFSLSLRIARSRAASLTTKTAAATLEYVFPK